MFEKQDSVYVIAQIPDIEEKDINIEIQGDKLDISAGIYSKRISLPCKSGSIEEKSYRNGVLQLKIKRKTMSINIDEKNLKKGLLGLVIALVEIIQDLLEKQALLRIENESLSDEEIERLGDALSDLHEAIEVIKTDNELEDCVFSVRDGLDKVVDEVIDKFLNPTRWIEEAEKNERNTTGEMPLSLLNSQYSH
ncbi:MAG: gas vesicle protein K [Methanosarcina barkeri]|nr:gas vesicle protein K [Methanosarcina sp. ERenArc_MAG2]